MNVDTKKLFVATLALCFSPMLGQTQLQQMPLAGPATKLSSVVYFDPPDEQRVKVRLEGAEMRPLPETKFDVRKLIVRRYSLTGKEEAVVEAPQCVYAPMDGVANSSGHVHLKLGDQVVVEGDGFLYQQSDESIDISNNVSTIIQAGSWSLSAP
jgi:hypothetical protein